MVLLPLRAQEPCPVPGPDPKQDRASPLWEGSEVTDPRAGSSESQEIWAGGRLEVLSRKFRTSVNCSAAQKNDRELAKTAHAPTVLLVTHKRKNRSWSSVMRR